MEVVGGEVWANSLYVLLAVQQELEQRAKKVLNTLAGYTVDNVVLKLLGAEVDHVLGEGLGEAVAEQNDELVGDILELAFASWDA